MPQDSNLILQASVTKTATFNGAAIILPGGTPRRGLVARVIYSATQQASGSGVWTFSIDVCYDGVPTTWNVDFVAPPITLTASAQSGEIFIPFSISPTSVVNGTQIRLSATLSGSPTTPTTTYSGALVVGRP
ncbi:MAG TPA: hypothetical protein VF974_00995 [Patescibacteria group bacterium]